MLTKPDARIFRRSASPRFGGVSFSTAQYSLRAMTSDLDIYRSANELIKHHGEAADIEAAMRADERLAAGDMEGEAVWLRIIKAIEELLSEERPEGEKVH